MNVRSNALPWAFAAILISSSQRAKEVQDQSYNHHRSDYPEAPTGPPLGISVIATTPTKQKQ